MSPEEKGRNPYSLGNWWNREDLSWEKFLGLGGNNGGKGLLGDKVERMRLDEVYLQVELLRTHSLYLARSIADCIGHVLDEKRLARPMYATAPMDDILYQVDRAEERIISPHFPLCWGYYLSHLLELSEINQT